MVSPRPLTSPMQFDQIMAAVGSIECPILHLSYTGARLLGWGFVSMQNEIKLSMFEVPLKMICLMASHLTTIFDTVYWKPW